MELIISLSFCAFCSLLSVTKLLKDKENKNINIWFFVYATGINNFQAFRLFDNSFFECFIWGAFIFIMNTKNIIAVYAVVRNGAKKLVIYLSFISFCTFPVLLLTLGACDTLVNICRSTITIGYSYAICSCLIVCYKVTRNKSLKGLSIPAHILASIDMSNRSRYNFSEGIYELALLNSCFLAYQVYIIIYWLNNKINKFINKQKLDFND